ncbi:GIY-YIG nuclease family protein [Paludifilum halophilum]|uniref:DUF4357 domain-containing protein n=1 Tax=Paludifilum halophilum TaxID=1642702 RepID=A0A235B6N8_9BACL|nr:GIY-YIG nuclease family protein [Paludifilum halophilum]OYD07275.1 hypothetical protein CHM34_12920 [Paludifilum halophilum]
MNRRPKTIQIFLPEGSPSSIKIASITSRMIQAIFIPRSQLQKAGKREEVKQVGIYFLFGKSEDRSKPQVYVGEAENCYDRLLQHHKKKDFWNAAVAVTTKAKQFTKTDVKFLESHAYRQLEEKKRYEVINHTVPTQPYVSEPDMADLYDHFDTIKVLLSTLGYPVFEDLKKPKEREIFYCERAGFVGKGQYTSEGFVVLSGTQMPKDTVKSVEGTRIPKVRQRLVEGAIVRDKGDHYLFTENHLFSSPSAAASVVLGRSANGWMEWKDKQERTLHELKRQ